MIIKKYALPILACVLSQTAIAQLATPDEKGLTFGHVHLNVADIEEHAAIWTEYFGGERIAIGPLTAIKFPNMLVVLRDQAPTMGSRETVLDHFGFKVRNIQSFIDKWEGDGLEMGGVFTGAEGQINAYVTLAGGVYVELQEDQGLHEEMTGYHVHYFSEGHDQLLQWYTDLFDLEVRARGTIPTTTNVPGMNVSFGSADTDRAPTSGAAIDHIGFEVDNLEAFVEKLKARGLEFDRPYTYVESLNLGTAFFTDPRGVVVELSEGLDNY